MDQEKQRQVRELFDAMCNLQPSHWRMELARRSADAQVIAETLELLQAQTRELKRARVPVEKLLAAMAVPELAEGDRLGPWRLCERLARGGMGVVFRAERDDGLYVQEVAIKFLLGDPGVRVAERLSVERRILAGLQHPNIARLYDGGTTPAGSPYLVMEYVRGDRLDDYCARRQLDLHQRLGLFLKVCLAVQAAHARLVLHCDLKPGNILVRADGEPVLLDFGIARLMEQEAHQGCVHFFTPGYAAPELYMGQTADITTDVYSLGVILTGLLSRQNAAGASADGRPPVAPSELSAGDRAWRRALRGDLDAIALRATAGRASERYASVEALVADIHRHLQHRPVRARGGGGLYDARCWLRRNWKGVAVLASIMLLATGFVWRLAETRAEARQQAQVAEQVSEFLVSMFEAADPREKGARAAEDIRVHEILDHATRRVETELGNSPEVRARLQGVIGLAYRNMGDVRRAGPLMQASAEALALRGGEKNIDEAARQFIMLADTHAYNRNGQKGEAMARHALALLGPQPDDSLRVAQAYSALGLSLLFGQHYDEAEQAFRQALRRHDLAGREPSIAIALGNLGMLYRLKGDLDTAAVMLEHSLPLLERVLGEMSFDHWINQSEQGLLLADQGRLDEAIATLQRNLEHAQRIFGERSVYYIAANNRLAGALIRKGDYPQADTLLRTALQLSAEVMGEDSFNYSVILATVAQLAEARGELAAAEAAWRKALVVRRGVTQGDHPELLELELQLGLLLARQGREEGDALVTHAYGAGVPQIPARSISGLRLRQGWAEWLLWKGRLKDARQVLAALAEESALAIPEVAQRQQRLQSLLLQRLREGQVTFAGSPTLEKSPLEG